MKFSEQWLRQWVNPPVTTQQLAEQLTMAGLEVESISPAAGDFNHVIVGHVLQVDPHPNADRLRVCQVNIGEAQPITVVCGGSNVRVGMKAAVALIGANLPNDLMIKKSKLRGVESFGMLCSVVELGMEESSSGLLELPEDAPIGEDLRKFLLLNDQIIDINITPNRGDCLSIAGIAREVATISHCELKTPAIKKITPTIKDVFSIHVDDSKACPRYVGRVIRAIRANVTTPSWLQERLRRSGIRSIHPVVDVTNYVMLELGNPLHVFDLKQLVDEINVRTAKTGEKIGLLNGSEIDLDEKTLIIADKKQPLAIAGVMGGQSSAITANSTDIFLESAFFSPISISRTARHFGLTSDSSYRFSRGVDPQLQITAIERATELLLTVVGGEPGPIIETTAEKNLPKPVTIQLRRSQIERILGITIADKTIEKILQHLGMIVTPSQEGWKVAVPSFRFDLTLEIDLIEEIARIHGYINIPSDLPAIKLAAKTTSENEITLARIRSLLMDRDYQEAITFSFIPKELQNLFDPLHEPLALSNPISQEMAVMRTTLWPGLVQALLFNQHRQEQRVRLFEIGNCFLSHDSKIQQLPKLAGIVTGAIYPEQWGVPFKESDFFDIKGDLQALFSLTGDTNAVVFKPFIHPALHPHQSAAIYRDQDLVGYLGAIHPQLLQQLGLTHAVYLFELNLLHIQKGLLPSFKEISKFPAVRRDIAIVVDKSLTVDEIRKKIVSSANELLKNVQIFDIYQGKGIDLGKKSVALGLTFQHPSRTLTDTEVNELLRQILTALNEAFKAKLRE